MSDDQPKRKQGSTGVLLVTLAIVLLPVGYVLFSGPAVWLFQHGYLTGVLPWIYKPLIYLEMSNTPLGDAIKWYWSLWK